MTQRDEAAVTPHDDTAVTDRHDPAGTRRTGTSEARHGSSAAPDRTGVVLAGGASRRFGDGDKALADLDGQPLLRRVVDRLSPVVDELFVSCHPAQVDRFDRALRSAPVDEIVVDRHVDAGPVAGIAAGLDAATGTDAAVVACDMPLVEPAVLETLFERARGSDGAVPEAVDGTLQPTQAVYSKRAMRSVVDRQLPEGGSLHAAVGDLSVATVPIEQFPRWSFHNVNTRRDLAVARGLLAATRRSGERPEGVASRGSATRPSEPRSRRPL